MGVSAGNPALILCNFALLSASIFARALRRHPQDFVSPPTRDRRKTRTVFPQSHAQVTRKSASSLNTVSIPNLCPMIWSLLATLAAAVSFSRCAPVLRRHPHDFLCPVLSFVDSAIDSLPQSQRQAHLRLPVPIISRIAVRAPNLSPHRMSVIAECPDEIYRPRLLVQQAVQRLHAVAVNFRAHCFFRYASMARRICSATESPVFSDRVLSAAITGSGRNMCVRVMPILYTYSQPVVQPVGCAPFLPDLNVGVSRSI